MEKQIKKLIETNNTNMIKWCHDFKNYTDKRFSEIMEKIEKEQHELVNEIKEYVDLKLKNEQ